MKYGLTFPNYGEYCDPRFMAELAYQSEEVGATWRPDPFDRDHSGGSDARKGSITSHPIFIELRNFNRLIAYT